MCFVSLCKITRTFDLICFRFSFKGFTLYRFLWLTYIRNRNKDHVSLNSSWFLLPPQKENWKRYIVPRSYMETGKFCIIFRRVCTSRLVCIFKPEEMFASGKEMGKGCGAAHSISDFFFLQVCYLRKIFGVKNSR